MITNRLITVKSIYGRNLKEALVEISFPNDVTMIEGKDYVIRVRPKDARTLAMNLLQGCEGAIVDAFLIDFMRDESIIDSDKPEYAAKLISAFRQYRAERYPE